MKKRTPPLRKRYWRKRSKNKITKKKWKNRYYLTKIAKRKNTRAASMVEIIKLIVEHYKLETWWDNFTEEEKSAIVEIYEKHGDPVATVEYEDGTEMSRFEFLWHFSADIGFRDSIFDVDYDIFSKTVRFTDSVADDEKSYINRHFYHDRNIFVLYSHRNKYVGANELAISACEQQIAISQKAAMQFLASPHPIPHLRKNDILPMHRSWLEIGGLPIHMGYKQLCIIHEKMENWQEVIHLAEKAKSEGWPDGTAGGWDKRIKKARKKLGELAKST